MRFVRKGLLEPQLRHDENAIADALYAHLERTLGAAAVTRNRLTVEELAKDTLDVRELHRAGLLTDDWITLRPSLRWPRIATMRLGPVPDPA